MFSRITPPQKFSKGSWRWDVRQRYCVRLKGKEHADDLKATGRNFMYFGLLIRPFYHLGEQLVLHQLMWQKNSWSPIRNFKTITQTAKAFFKNHTLSQVLTLIIFTYKCFSCFWINVRQMLKAFTRHALKLNSCQQLAGEWIEVWPELLTKFVNLFPVRN